MNQVETYNTLVPTHSRRPVSGAFTDVMREVLPMTAPQTRVETPAFHSHDVRAYYGVREALHGINLDIPRGKVTAIIGPSGCGKSTYLRCLNRMHELVPGATVTGRIELEGENVYDDRVDPVLLRRRVGMVFQKPNPFPMMSIRENVLSGLRFTGRLVRAESEHIVESALRQAALWDEVKDKLNEPGISLSGGQQQRLCIARAVAPQPGVLLMDEPCSALDPIATARIEDLIKDLVPRYSVVIVTHNMQQAMRVSNYTAFFLNGDLIEFDDTERVFGDPIDRRTADYVSGKFG